MPAGGARVDVVVFVEFLLRGGGVVVDVGRIPRHRACPPPSVNVAPASEHSGARRMPPARTSLSKDRGTQLGSVGAERLDSRRRQTRPTANRVLLISRSRPRVLTLGGALTGVPVAPVSVCVERVAAPVSSERGAGGRRHKPELDSIGRLTAPETAPAVDVVAGRVAHRRPLGP